MPSHRRSQLTYTLAAGLAAATLAASPAGASPMLEPGSDDLAPLPEYRASEVTTIDQGFDWGSAAIGAGGAGAVLVLVSIGGVALASSRTGGGATRPAAGGR